MKLFRNSALSSGGGPVISAQASGGPILIGSPTPIDGGGGSSSANGFGYAWDSLTGKMDELRWAKPSNYPNHSSVEGYRPDDAKVYGATYYQMESDGQLYLSALYIAQAGSAAGAIDVVDVYDTFSYRLGSDVFTAGGKLISCGRYSPSYLVVDYSGSAPLIVTGSAAAWGVIEVQDGDVLPLLMKDAPPRLMAVYSGDGNQIQLLVSSPLDGKPLAIALRTTIPAGQAAAPGSVTADKLYEMTAQTGVVMRPVLEALGALAQTAAFTVVNYTGGNLALRSLLGLWWTYPSEGAQLQGRYGEFGQPVDVISFRADRTGVVTRKEYFSPPDGMAPGSQSLPDLDFTPPVVPPFWRGFVKTFETI